MLAYGTNLVGGVTPARAAEVRGQGPHLRHRGGRREATGANASVIYVPPPFAADAIWRPSTRASKLVICITEGIPVLDMVKVNRFLQGRQSRLIGPELPGRHHAGRVQDRHHARPHPQAPVASAWSRARAR
jgi:succinyl-CoA synthetase alpha subunit